jgi:hypothetical protein
VVQVGVEVVLVAGVAGDREVVVTGMLASLVVEVAGAPLVTGTVVVLVWMVTVVGTVMVRLGGGRNVPY